MRDSKSVHVSAITVDFVGMENGLVWNLRNDPS